MNFAKFLRTSFLPNTSGQLLLLTVNVLLGVLLTLVDKILGLMTKRRLSLKCDNGCGLELGFHLNRNC